MSSNAKKSKTTSEPPKTEEERLQDYDLKEIDGIKKLVHRMKQAETIEDWSFILSDYISFGNNKLDKSIAIFNMNSATDCPNIGTDHCQVPQEACYAHKAEKQYPQPLDYRRRQEFLWDCLDAETFAKAFLKLVSRKRNEVKAIRFSESGDFRHRGDIIKINRISQILQEEAGIHSYTYSASDYLDWSESGDFQVNASNDRSDYGDQKYKAVPSKEDIPEDGIHCPNEKSVGEVKCGDCMLCITGTPQDRDVYITIH